MIRSLLVSAYVGFLIHSLLALFIGTTGAIELDRLAGRNRILSENLEELDDTREHLNDTLASLRGNPDAVRIAARSLGLYRSDDRVVFFGPNTQMYRTPQAGRVLYAATETRNDDRILRLVSLFSGLIVMMTITVIRRISHDRSA